MKEKIIDILTNGSDSQIQSLVNTVFNGNSELFMSFLEKNGLLSDENIYDYLIEEMPMTYLSNKFKTNPDKTTKYIVDNYFGDISSENGRYILKLDNREDLSIFFKRDGGRDMSSQELAKLILQEDWWEPFYDSLQDVYDEVIENLTPENLKLLAEKINDELSGSEVDPYTSLLEDIAEDQGHPEYVELSVDLLLNTIFEDKESTKYILNHEANDTDSELYSLYHNAFNTAYVDEKWENLTSELKSLLGIENIGEYRSRKVKNYKGEEVNISDYFIDVTNFLPDVIKSTFDDRYMNDDYRNQFEYYGSFESFVEEMIYENVIEGGSLYMPYYDYPDHDRVERYMNEMFRDYI